MLSLLVTIVHEVKVVFHCEKNLAAVEMDVLWLVGLW